MPRAAATITQQIPGMGIPFDPNLMSYSLLLQVEGAGRMAIGFFSMPFGTAYQALVAEVKTNAATVAIDQLGIELGPDDITIFGGPAPTLADLGGSLP